MTLLTKTRKLNRLLQQEADRTVSFMDMAEMLRDVLKANVYVVSRKGKVLGFSIINQLPFNELSRLILEEKKIPDDFNDALLRYGETAPNITPDEATSGIAAHLSAQSDFKYMSIVPIVGGRERLGTILLTRVDNTFIDDDFVLAEYGSTIVGMEILRERTEEIEVESRNRAVVQVAIGSLSFSELEAVENIFQELEGKEGLLVASKIADRAGITRSVIVNALRKLESAGVIETRSLGMKGTYIRILNSNLLPAIEQMKVRP